MNEQQLKRLKRHAAKFRIEVKYLEDVLNQDRCGNMLNAALHGINRRLRLISRSMISETVFAQTHQNEWYKPDEKDTSGH